MLPKLHPLYKTHVDLKRCMTRLDEFIARFPEDQTNEVERYLKLYNLLDEAKNLIPEQFYERV